MLASVAKVRAEGIPVPEIDRSTEQNVAEVPLYTLSDAARYLHVPAWFALPVFLGRPPYRLLEPDEWFWHRGQFWPRLADDFGPALRGHEPARVSFRSLAALFVASAVLESLPPGAPSEPLHRGELEHLFATTSDVTWGSNDPALLADPEWVAGRYARFSDRLPEADRVRLLKAIVLRQSRIESRDGAPVRFFPFSRDPAPDTPRAVVIDPELRFGRPSVEGVPTDVLTERWRAGDRVADLAEDYGLTTDEVEEAIRYEAAPNRWSSVVPFLPFGW
jgi:uncharacterized protein (DUF433 family)